MGGGCGRSHCKGEKGGGERERESLIVTSPHPGRGPLHPSKFKLRTVAACKTCPEGSHQVKELHRPAQICSVARETRAAPARCELGSCSAPADGGTGPTLSSVVGQVFVCQASVLSQPGRPPGCSASSSNAADPGGYRRTRTLGVVPQSTASAQAAASSRPAPSTGGRPLTMF